VLVKICGIMRREDAEAAVEAGADALGFVFWSESPRRVDAERARDLTADLPDRVMKVGVFVNERADNINRIADRARLTAVQLHGDERPDAVDSITRPIIKAVTPATAGRWPGRVMLLVDAYDPVRRGGTGVNADWAWAAQLAASRPVILAGGVTPENVCDALRVVKPYGIDVSSGVERSPGIKERARLRSLFEAVRGAESSAT
jgi:phosphoribosylanthranilate isomerase